MRKVKQPDRWERIVSKEKRRFQCIEANADYFLIPDFTAAAILRREHRAVVRMVRELLKRDRVGQLVNQPGYTAACDDVLAKLKARGQ